MHQVQGEVIHLLHVATGGDLSLRPLDEHAAVELRNLIGLVRRHPVGGELLEKVRVRLGEVVRHLVAVDDRPPPRPCFGPDEPTGRGLTHRLRCRPPTSRKCRLPTRPAGSRGAVRRPARAGRA